MLRTSLLAGTVALALMAGCATTGTPATVADATARNPQLTTLNKLITDAGLTDTLKGPGPFTVFAPSDEAFKAVPAKTLAELSTDKAKLKEVLSYHVLPGKVGAADVRNGNAKTVQGANLALGKAGGYVTVEDAMVTQADLGAANGVVHVIDRVLMPPKK